VERVVDLDEAGSIKTVDKVESTHQ
jgi:hypothetical protein